MARPSNKKIISQLEHIRARYALCDLHVHSPASYDVRSTHYDSLPRALQTALKAISKPNRDNEDAVRHYQHEVLAAYPPSSFLQDLVAHRDSLSTSLHLSPSDDWAIIAITDHNICSYSCEVSKLAFQNRGENRLIVLPAIELDVNFPVPQVGTSTAHILCLFAPETDADDIQNAINQASPSSSWKEGKPVHEVNDLPSFVHRLRHDPQTSGICIAAHVSSSKGVHKECSNALRLTYDQATISQLSAALETEELSGGEVSDITSNRASLERSYDEEIQVATLRLIGRCGFDSLQVGAPSDHKHFRRLHRHREDRGRCTLIVCSDAHTPERVLSNDAYVPHLKIGVNLAKGTATTIFSSIKQSLRLAETRFITRPIARNEAWIESLCVSLDSPSSNSFWKGGAIHQINLSRNLTCVVGGRGSGKSALLDAIGFVARPSDFDDVSSAGRHKELDHIERSKRLFKGQEMRVCWKFAGADIPTEYKKGVFASRYFGEGDDFESVELTDINEGSAESAELPKVTVLRFQELEQHATGDRLRAFLDAIKEQDLCDIHSELRRITKELEDNRTFLRRSGERILNLVQPRSPLRTYAENHNLFHQINSNEMQSHFEKVDDAVAAGQVIRRANEAIRGVGSSVVESGFEDAINKISLDELRAGEKTTSETEELRVLKSELDRDDPESLLGDLIKTSGQFRQSLDNASERTGELYQAARKRYKEREEELRKRGIPSGGKERLRRRERLEESEEALRQYREEWAELERLLEERERLRKKLIKCGVKRTRLRESVCALINDELNSNLDSSVLVINARPGEKEERSSLEDWLVESLNPTFSRYRRQRAQALVNSGIEPGSIRDALFDVENCDSSQFVTEAEEAAGGRITTEEAMNWLTAKTAVSRLDPEAKIADLDAQVRGALPEEVRSGLRIVGTGDSDSSIEAFEHALLLDELEFDDQPSVFMNDRPMDPGSTMRPIDEMSPGQRCSALLPILLLSDHGPLLVDQPEDNLDNRLIREVIVNVLATMKLRRQIVVATHNPNLPVLGDAEQVIALRAVGENEAEVVVSGDLDNPEVVREITEIMEGGREAFQYRSAVYGAHWRSDVETSS